MQLSITSLVVVLAGALHLHGSLAQTPVRTLLRRVALNGGSEFNDRSSYQSRALSFVEGRLSPQPDSLTIQFYALACIYYASSNQSNKRIQQAREPTRPWIISTRWVTNSNFCTWYGVTCSNGRVSRLALDSNRMQGIFAPEVQLLRDTLTVLDLNNNPHLVTSGDAGNRWIASMTNLRQFYFGTTSFEYFGVPIYFSTLVNLRELDFSNTFFTNGPIRSSAFSGMRNLEYLDMADNIYTSTIPQSIARHPTLAYLYVDNVEFVGVDQTLDFLVTMPRIIESWNDFTFFQGGLPNGFTSINTLRSFSCTFCTLSGRIPNSIGNMQNLQRLWLYENQLTGTIPTQLGQLRNMQDLELEENNLRGSMPNQVCNIQSIRTLGSDCHNGEISCSCCTCCGGDQCDSYLDGTPSPTAAPGSGSGGGGGLFCFPGDSTVELASGEMRQMQDLEIGDKVKNGDIVEPVYSFGHRNKASVNEFIEIAVKDQSIRLSKNHMIFTDNGAVPASLVVVGDKVALANGDLATVEKIASVQAKGIYAPFTPSGKIAVNGIMASNFITFEEKSESVLVSGLKVINTHTASHMFMASHRLLCNFWASVCEDETYDDETGMNTFLSWPLRIIEWIFTKNDLIVGAFLVPFIAVSGVTYIFEQNMMAVVAALAGAIWFLRKGKVSA